jgi:hypothetical protein
MANKPKTRRKVHEVIPFAERPYCGITQARQATSLGRTKIFAMLKSGEIESVLVNGRRLIVVQSLLRLGRSA